MIGSLFLLQIKKTLALKTYCINLGLIKKEVVMKKTKVILLLIMGLLLFVGCEEGARVKVINQTKHNVYAEIDGKAFTVSGNSSYEVDVETKEKKFLFADGITKKTLKIEGETFRIWDDYEEVYNNQTSIKVTPGKTYNVYCTANSASVKVINNSAKKVTKLHYRKNSQFATGTWFTIIYDPPLEYEEFGYYHLTPQTEQNRFFYNFKVETESGEVTLIGDEFQGIELLKDEQFLIEIVND